jgi:hypothetical protein
MRGTRNFVRQFGLQGSRQDQPHRPGYGQQIITTYTAELWIGLEKQSELWSTIAGMSGIATFVDRRQRPRFRVLKSARIVLNDRASTLDCTVRNVSDGGACLVLATASILPLAFELSIDGLPYRTCRVVWQYCNRVGVKFQAGEEG